MPATRQDKVSYQDSMLVFIPNLISFCKTVATLPEADARSVLQYGKYYNTMHMTVPTSRINITVQYTSHYNTPSTFRHATTNKQHKQYTDAPPFLSTHNLSIKVSPPQDSESIHEL